MSLGHLGKYELLERLSKGGMGELFVARTVGPGGFERLVALKRIRTGAGQDENFIQMFVQEAKVASLLSHQNLVHLYDFGSEGDVHFLAMELVEGRDLGRILARCREVRTPFPIDIAVRIAAEVATGLDHLHRLNHRGQGLQLVHRDVSPQNVMVSFDGAVKVTDFGIVSVKRRERLTRLGVVKGKVGYLSPEQVTNRPVDARSDVFSLGIVLWECLTGARLFPGTVDVEVLQQVLQKPLRPPSSLNAEVPAGLDAVVMRALERDRQRRFQDAGELARALQALPGLRTGARELAQMMRRLYPEEAQERLLKLSTSVELAAVAPAAGSELPPTLPDHHLTADTTDLSTPGLTPGQAPPSRDTQGEARRRAVAAALGFAVVAVAGGLSLLWRNDTSSLARRLGTEAAGEGAPAPATLLDSAAAPEPVVVAQAPTPPAAKAEPATMAPSPPPTTHRRAGSPRPPARGQVAAPGTVASAAVPPATLAVVQLHPWAEVLLDGRSQEWFSPGRWPVAAGRHEITLQNAEAGVERHFSLRFVSGGTVLFRGELKSVQPRSDE